MTAELRPYQVGFRLKHMHACRMPGALSAQLASVPRGRFALAEGLHLLREQVPALGEVLEHVRCARGLDARQQLLEPVVAAEERGCSVDS